MNGNGPIRRRGAGGGRWVAVALAALFCATAAGAWRTIRVLEVRTAADDAAPARRRNVPSAVRGVHLTAWVAGSPGRRARIERLLRETGLNAVAIDIKETAGMVYLPGVREAEDAGTYEAAMPDVREYVRRLGAEGVYTIARMVVFRDDELAARRPDLAVADVDGGVWRDRHGGAWLDPYRPGAREYNLAIAGAAAAAGFDEIQFDYIRFPSDGRTSRCRYAEPFSPESATAALEVFLDEARRRVGPRCATSIAVFGLTTTVDHGMGIGQRIERMAALVDFVSPMVYPSHYAAGSYGVRDPEAAPYTIVSRGLFDARGRLGGDAAKLRPYLQDFSLRVEYGPERVRDQIRAARECGIESWLLWNPRCRYTEAALGTPEEAP